MMRSFFKSDQYVKDPMSKIKYPISSSSSSTRSSSSSHGRSRFSHSPTIMYQTGHIINHIGNLNLVASEPTFDTHPTFHHEFNDILPSSAYARAEPTYARILTPPTTCPSPMASNHGPLPQLTANSVHVNSPATLPERDDYVPNNPTAPDHRGQTFADIDYVQKLHATLTGSESGLPPSISGSLFLAPTNPRLASASPGDHDKKFKTLTDDLSKLRSMVEGREQAELHAKIRAEGVEEGKQSMLPPRRTHVYLDSGSSEYDSSNSDNYGISRGRRMNYEQVFLPSPPPYPPRSHTTYSQSDSTGGFVVAGGGPSGGVSIYPSPGPSHLRSRSYTRIREIHNDDENDRMVNMTKSKRERDHRRMIIEKADMLRLEDAIRNGGASAEMIGAYRY